MITATDLFAGAGGSSTGMATAGVQVRIAANHWPTAIETHQANHPDTEHDCADISQVDPRRYPRTDLLWASPSCTHHSRAQGKRRGHGLGLFDRQPATLAELVALEPDRARATMHDVIRFAEHHRYETVITENVPEVTDWPLFPYWLAMMTDGLGYHYQPRIICSADANRSGAAVAQIRTRWFGVFTRRRVSLPHWTETADRPGAGSYLDADPGRPLTAKPRAQATMERVEATVSRYPDAGRWLISYYGSSKVGKPATEPAGTLTTHDRHAVLTDVAGTLHYRMVNTTEQARLQGFPATYQWRGRQSDITKQIGNSVVPAVARDLVTAVAASLT